jgi:hypothetical protein
METTKMTVRVSRDILEQAKLYAQAHDTTLTRLINAYLQQIAAGQDPLSTAPIVQRLTGSLSAAVGQDDYRRHLDEKYGRPG